MRVQATTVEKTKQSLDREDKETQTCQSSDWRPGRFYVIHRDCSLIICQKYIFLHLELTIIGFKITVGHCNHWSGISVLD